MTAHTAQTLSFILAIVLLTGVLIWGLRLISSVLRQTHTDGASVLRHMVSEHAETTANAPAPGAVPPPMNANAPAPAPGPSGPGKGSFSRLAGAVGAIGLAATFIGIGYWVLFALFFGGDLTKLDDIGTYFLSGSALFAPYAFNKLSTVFK